MRAFFTLLVSQPKGQARLAPFLAKRFLVNPNYLIDNLGKFEMREIPRILDRWKF
jgi:hypothetical protein